MLHVYRKSDGKYFTCWPSDICHEWDGDDNPFLDPPELLGSYRKIYEPHWSPSVNAFLDGSVSAQEKMAIAAYMANLMTCTPTWARIGASMHAQMVEATLRFKDKLEQGRDALLSEGLRALEDGEIELVTDPQYVKAVSTRGLLRHALAAYNLDWTVLVNRSDIPFVTSDHPVAMLPPGRPHEPLKRYLSLTPQICLYIEFHPLTTKVPEMSEVPAMLSQTPSGTINHQAAAARSVKVINRLIVQCAEDLVISSSGSAGIEALTRKYRYWGLDSEVITIENGETNRQLHLNRIILRERKAPPHAANRGHPS
jgi:hypothetical protein